MINKILFLLKFDNANIVLTTLICKFFEVDLHYLLNRLRTAFPCKQSVMSSLMMSVPPPKTL